MSDTTTSRNPIEIRGTSGSPQLITRHPRTAPFASGRATSQVLLRFGGSGRVNARTVLKGCAASLLLLSSSCGSMNFGKDQESYEITEPVSSLVIDAQAGEVIVKACEGPVKVTETYHYSKDKPRTSHQVDGSTLRLTETGCITDELHCNAGFDVRVPATTAAEIKTDAGAIRLSNLSGDITVVTDAGAVEAATFRVTRYPSQHRRAQRRCTLPSHRPMSGQRRNWERSR